MSRASELKPGASIALRISTVALACAVSVAWGAQLILAPVNSDAGFYIPHALLVLQGDVPYRDFPSGYPPGIYYLLALLGEEGLRSPITFKLLVCVVQLANSLLVYAVLRRLGNDRLLSSLFTACFAGLTLAAWGIAFQLEPFQNLFVLSALWLLLGDGHPARSVAAGLALGAALMIKQYAVFAILPLALVSVAPMTPTQASAAPRLRGRSASQLVFLLAAVPVPYFLFIGLTQIDPVENLLHVATFGGAAGTYGAWGFERMFNTVAAGHVGRFLLPTLLLAVWLTLRHPSWRLSVLSLGLALSVAPLYMRTFEYYLQPTLPWSIFIMAEFSRVVGRRFRDAAAVSTLSAVLITLPLLGIIWQGSKDSFDPFIPLSAQIEVARELEQEIGSSQDVLVLNGSWLYTLTNFVPPLKDYSFNVNPATDEDRRATTRFAIIFGGSGPVRSVWAWLEEDGMQLRRQLRWRHHVIYILDREAG